MGGKEDNLKRFISTGKTMVYVGIDNGTSGTIGVITPKETIFFQTPIIKQQSYTKIKANISRIDYRKLVNFLETFAIGERIICLVERPMVNPGRFKATVSALRALEATQIALEETDTPYQFEDSKAWQKLLLPAGLKGEELKKASMDIGIRLFPEHKELIEKHKDADGLLLAEYARRVYGR